MNIATFISFILLDVDKFRVMLFIYCALLKSSGFDVLVDY